MSSSKTLTVKIAVKHFMQWDDPFNGKVKHCRFYVPIKKLPAGLPIDPVNTRPQNIKQKLYQNVVRTATNKPEQFHHNNNGMFVIVRSFKKISSEYVELTFGPKDGIGDGAHSYLSCLEANNRTGGCEGFISFNVVSQLDEKTLKQSCLARNSSVANKTFTRYNYEGHFDFIKNTISNQLYANLVSYRENEGNKRIPVRNLISAASLFAQEDTADYNPSVLSYLNKTYTLAKYIETQKENPKQNGYAKTQNILNDIYFLYDYISLAICKVHEEKTLKTQNTLNSDFVRASKTKAGTKFYFMNILNKYSCNEAVIFPILGAIKSQTMVDKRGNLKWKKDLNAVCTLIDKKAKKLYEASCTQTQRANGDLNVIGKNPQFWTNIHLIMTSK